ncbi:MAG: GNAT family N-acetyltransferase [Prosthecobacter sp.]|nr:GNAT family N-acetyltransferase [Prosthecobacter sp.]
MRPSSFFREATSSDAPAMAAIYQRCLTVADWMPEEVKATADFDRDTEGERLFVEETGAGRILGYVAVWEPESFIHHLYVDPEVQGRRVGVRLLTSLLDHVALPWRLKCSCSNQRAHQFYLSQGWVELEMGDSEAGPYMLMELTDGV